MILAPKQADRFHRLFNPLMEYVAKRLMAADALDPRKIRSEADYNLALFEAVWGKDGDVTLLDGYVQEAPFPLSPSDADEVLSWKSGLLSVFPVLREGDDVIFLYGEHAFAVRGITREIDVTMGLPAFAEGVIVPFDGLITYGTTLMEQPVQIQGNMPASLRGMARECAKTGRLAHTAEEFKRLVVEAREASERGRIEREEWKASMDAAAGELIEGQYRSPLADVGWDERMEAFEESWREVERMAISITLDRVSTREHHGTSLADCLMSLTKNELVDIAEIHKLAGGYKRLRKAELVDALVEAIDYDARDFVTDTAQLGARKVRMLRDVVRAGGRRDFTDSDVATFDDVPQPILPVLWLFRSGDNYSLIVPDEFQGPLSALPDDLFGLSIEKATVLDVFLRHAEVMVQLRGVVPRAELLQMLREFLGDTDPAFFLGGIIRRMGSGELNFRDAQVPGISGGAYLHANLFTASQERSSSATIADPALVTEIVESSKRFPARNGSEFEDLEALERWMYGHATYQALVTYLDGCVPEDEDDRSWAVKYANRIVERARGAYTTQEVMGLMVAEDLYLSEAQRTHVIDLIGTLLNDVPKWTNNGWAPNELRDRRSQGRSRRPAAMMPGAMRPSASRPDVTATPRRPKRKRPHKKRRR